MWTQDMNKEWHRQPVMGTRHNLDKDSKWQTNTMNTWSKWGLTSMAHHKLHATIENIMLQLLQMKSHNFKLLVQIFVNAKLIEHCDFPQISSVLLLMYISSQTVCYDWESHPAAPSAAQRWQHSELPPISSVCLDFYTNLLLHIFITHYWYFILLNLLFYSYSCSN